LIDEMERSGEPLTITRRGKPSLTLTAQRAQKPDKQSIFGCMKGSVTFHDDVDLVAPIDPDWEEKWLAKWDERLRDDAA
jgi:antitoxin (DNA-binding transcriptional repressor) of toxin-antitoxin stability system